MKLHFGVTALTRTWFVRRVQNSREPCFHVGFRLKSTNAARIQIGLEKNSNYSSTVAPIKVPIDLPITRDASKESQSQIETDFSKIELLRKEKSILVDRFGRMHNYLRISLTEKCNLRCRYCMPEEGISLAPKQEMLTSEEILHIAKVFVGQGITKIRLTGGEPLIRKDIVELCREFGRMEKLEDICITTNGILLERKLGPLIDAGVNRINISLDTLVEPKFEFITRRSGFQRVKRVIEKAVVSDLDTVKVNCVVKRGFNEDELVDFVDWTKDLRLEVRFIEYMPFDGNKWNPESVVPYYEMVDIIKQAYPEFSRNRQRDGPNPTSKTWSVPGFTGNVGFISSMSKHFCGSCNRLRITADGNLKACLFGSRELSLRDVLRQEDVSPTNREMNLLATLRNAVWQKDRSLGGYNSPEDIAKAENNREMIRIGG